jgi:hypothetical protein
LYAQNRSRPDEVFDIVLLTAEPLTLGAESRHELLAAAMAHLLAVATDGGVSEQASGPFEPPEAVPSRVGAFNVATAWKRFRASPLPSGSAGPVRRCGISRCGLEILPGQGDDVLRQGCDSFR